MYSIELTIKLSPLPLIVQRKDHGDAERLYSEVIDTIKKGNQRLIELTELAAVDLVCAELL